MLLLASTAVAQTTQPTLSADLGFAGVFKPDAWMPVYVRVADDQPRSATLELRTTRGRAGHVVEARIHTSSTPTTFTLYAPPVGILDHATLQLRDNAGRLLRELDLSDRAAATPAALGGPAFGVAGEPSIAQRVVNQLVHDTEENIAAGAIPSTLLPDRPIGYEAIDVLVLPELDTDALDDATESAIVRWVRAGGIVVAWPGVQAPTVDSPLRAILPARVGGVVERTLSGQSVAIRQLDLPTDTIGIRELSDHDGTIYERRVGLGQIVLCAFDPTAQITAGEARIALWRRLTSNQLHLLASERRNGLFDPLVAQARGEQGLQAMSAPPSHRAWLLGGLLLCVAMGPGELVLLAAARRHPRTPLTIAGLIGTVGFVAAAALYHPPAATAAQHIDVQVETDDGPCAMLAIAPRVVPGNVQATWLAGDRLDPTHQPAGELRLAQRNEDFAMTDHSLIALTGGASAALRSTDFPATAGPAVIAIQPDGAVRNASTNQWSALAIASPNGFVEAAGVAADGVATVGSPPPAIKPSTGRAKTGIEQLAERDEWAAILMDRTIASRLVQLQEAEGATIRIARIDRPDGTTFVVHVSRPKS